jgi:hypothetical protein
MSQLSSSSTFKALFNTALQDYKNKTGSSLVTLVDHPFTKQFLECDPVESITTILGGQARIFREFRDRRKVVNSLKCLVDVLCSPFFTAVLDKAIELSVRPKSVHQCTLLLIVVPKPFPPAKAIFSGIRILLAVCLSSSDPSISP